jgi:uncharacterized protein YbbC (DUF1343 family)
MRDDMTSPGGPVRNGIDVLEEDGFAALREARVALVTNHTGLTLDGLRTIDVLFACDDLFLDRIFAPEFGLNGELGAGVPVPDSVDQSTGLAVFGIFGERDRLTPESLNGIDVLLFDVQDSGCRLTSLGATLGHTLEACVEAGVRMLVLDRPNPIGGLEIDGPSSDAVYESPANYHPLPLRHGLTVGELARLFNGEREIGANLRVATMAGWQRDLWMDRTGQAWAAPVPCVNDLAAAILYPALGLLEGSGISVGRGTPDPYHVIGAPWIDGTALAKRLAAEDLPGMRCEAITFTPAESGVALAGVECNGVRFDVDDPSEIAVGPLALALIRALRAGHSGRWHVLEIEERLARPDLIEAVEDDAAELDDLWQPDPDYYDLRAKYLLY